VPIPTQTAPPPADTPDVVTEDYCLTSPLYPVGTEIVVPRSAVLLVAVDNTVPGQLVSADRNSFKPSRDIPSGTVIEITGPFVETGTCDLWPVRYKLNVGLNLIPSTFQGLPGDAGEGFIDERDLRPAG
jgi:hypothetical protein